MHVSKTAMHSVWDAAPTPPLGEDVIPLSDFRRSVTLGNPWRPLLHTLYLAEEIALFGGDGDVRPAASGWSQDD